MFFSMIFSGDFMIIDVKKYWHLHKNTNYPNLFHFQLTYYKYSSDVARPLTKTQSSDTSATWWRDQKNP